MRAKAAVAVAPWRVEVREVCVPDPGPEDVVLRLTHSWISNGTEGSFVRGERIAGDTPRSDTDPLPFPHVPGYQKVGVVESVGGEVTSVEAGDVVFATVSRVDDQFYDTGGHVSPAVTHHSQVWRLPPGLPPVAASGLVLTQVGYNVAMRPSLSPGDAAVVLGDGMVGQWAAQTLAYRGARVLVAGKHAERLALLGDGIAQLDVTQADLSTAVREWAPSGLQAIADTVGSIETLEALLPQMRHLGHISSAGFYGRQGLLDVQKLRSGELTLHAPSGWTKDRMDATLELLHRGVLRTEHLITHRFPIDRAADAYDLILHRHEPVLGVILDW
ncbi:MAG TPA: zinc-binding dehydrogenase [Armatimonadota bacterium]|jgi:2-desacetyl-2-hydroxyethyl bacteriochlorophyllide A dehydrogenase